MFKIHIQRTVDKPIDEVFEALCDHARYNEFNGVTVSKLLEEGHEERNGLGALRLIEAGGLKLKERITAFKRPNQMNYLIESSKPFTIQHDIGEIKLVEADGKTRVDWVSEGRISVPLVGRLLDIVFEKQGPKAFHSVLKGIQQR